MISPKDLIIKARPLINNYEAYQGFLTILEQEESISVARLAGKPSESDLTRISAEYNLLQKLKKTRESMLQIEKSLVVSPNDILKEGRMK